MYSMIGVLMINGICIRNIKMDFEFNMKNNIGIIKPKGNLDAASAKRFKTSFDHFLERTNCFVFDFSNVKFIDSSGLGVLISCMKKSGRLDGDIYIANLQSNPKVLFEITKADRIFEMYDNVEAAIDKFFSK